MTLSEILTMTKCDLQIAGTAFDSYLGYLIGAAQASIEREGVTLNLAEIEDCSLIVMYASYLYRKRAGENPGMPRQLRYALNNRLFSQKSATEDGDET